jgi:3-(3-hydroxy-phenyl)propionate hydroxylase
VSCAISDRVERYHAPFGLVGLAYSRSRCSKAKARTAASSRSFESAAGRHHVPAAKRPLGAPSVDPREIFLGGPTVLPYVPRIRIAKGLYVRTGQRKPTPCHFQCSAHRALAARPRSVRRMSGPNQNLRKRKGMRMTKHAVVIAGGGPTGLMLAGELALAGIDVAIVERRASQELDGSRSGGLHSRTIEVLDQRGIADRFLAEGQAMQVQAFAGIPLDISDFPTRHNYGLALWQSHFERILAAWVSELGVPIAREREVTGFAQDDTGVDVELSDGQSLRADYLVGCDGGRSVIRKAAGIEFPGWDPSTSWLIAEVEMDEEPEFGMREGGGIGRVEDGGSVRVVLTEQHLEHTSEPTLQDLSEALIVVDGTDYGVHSPTWISRFTDMTRQAASYRKGRVLLAGDAAHVHPPQGGQGLNTGVQDAVNLGWKLAQVVNGTSPDGLLDTYHAERHPVGARVLHNTMAQVALSGTDERTDALRDTMTELLSMDEPRKRFADDVSGLDIHYDLGEGHPLLGRRMPDLDLVTADGPLRVFTLLHDAKPVLLNLGEPGGFDITPWADRVQMIDAEYVGLWELPVLGAVTAPTAVLIRPDGYVAWVGDGTDGLRDALTTWFGTA